MIELDRPEWLSISIGTSNGFTISLRPLSFEAPLDSSVPPLPVPSSEDKSRFLAILSRLTHILEESEVYESEMQRKVLRVGGYQLSAGGLGLAIPHLTATVNLNRGKEFV